MKKSSKVWLITAVSLVVLGSIIFGGAMMGLGWDFSKLSTVKYETNEYKIIEEYSSISIITDTDNIKLFPSENGETKVICCENKKLKHSVSVKDNTLVIELDDNRKWFDHIGINFGSPKISVYLPEGEYDTLDIKSSTGKLEIPGNYIFQNIDISHSTGDVDCCASAKGDIKIKTSTGNINVADVSAGSLSVSVSTGSVNASRIKCEGDVSVKVSTGKSKLSDIECKSLASSGNTGDITLSGVVASEKFDITRTTGDVTLDGCDAGEIYIKTDTGDVKGSLYSEKVFITKTDTGDINVPKTISGGRCEIETDTGDIRFE